MFNGIDRSSVEGARKKVLNSYISYATFNVTGENPYQYIETYITFDRGSLVYVKMPMVNMKLKST